jgi:hypothetical protein
MQFYPSLYYPVFIYSLLILSLGYSVYLSRQTVNWIQQNSNSNILLIYVFLFILFVGLRPISGVYFGDTSNYALMYNGFIIGYRTLNLESSEWVFEWMQYQCSKIMDVHGFFLLVEVFYVIPVLWACYRFVPNHYILMFLFCMGAFSFFSYGTNGIRNGMACSLIIAALAYINNSTVINKIIAGILCFLAFNIHRSTALPIICMVTSYYVKNTRYVMWWWLFSIVLSLVAGGTIESFFTGLGFDDRMEGYSSENIDASMFSSTGFRWDFLLYSAMPIVLGYYVIFIRKIWDKSYLLLLNTYILCNSFWVMMIRASYSNRFAYLSWFMYALVLAYPCLKLPIWKNQGSKTALIFMGHLGFTLFMYWFM